MRDGRLIFCLSQVPTSNHRELKAHCVQQQYHLSPSVFEDDDPQVVQASMDRPLREEGEFTRNPPELAAGDFYGNPPLVQGPIYRVDVAVGQDDIEATVNNDDDLYGDEEEREGPYEDEGPPYIPSYLEGLFLDESSDLVVRYFDHNLSEVQDLVVDDDEDIYEEREEEEGDEEAGGEAVADEEEGDEVVDDEEEGDDSADDEEEGDEVVDEEEEGDEDEDNEVEDINEEERDTDEERCCDSSPGDEEHSINSQLNEEWYSGRRSLMSLCFICSSPHYESL